MIIIGVVLPVSEFLLKIPIVWTIGILVLVIGLIPLRLGATGHSIAARRHYL